MPRHRHSPGSVNEIPEPIDEEPVKEAPKVPMFTLRALLPYHNAMIQGGIGIHWKQGEVRDVTGEQFHQLRSDNPRVFERVY